MVHGICYFIAFIFVISSCICLCFVLLIFKTVGLFTHLMNVIMNDFQRIILIILNRLFPQSPFTFIQQKEHNKNEDYSKMKSTKRPLPVYYFLVPYLIIFILFASCFYTLFRHPSGKTPV